MEGVSGTPLVDLRAQYTSLAEEMDDAIQTVLRSCQFVGGEAVAAFEREFSAFCGVGQAVGCASGTDAIRLAMRAAGVGSGDEVVVPAFTFIATASPAVELGAHVRFADVDSDTLTIDPAEVARVLGPRTKAVVAVDLYGQPAAWGDLKCVTADRDLVLIEDAAQAHGARYHGTRAGALASLGCFSFYPSKNLGAYGDGGAITTDAPQLAERLRLLRDHGQQAKYDFRLLGGNSRLDTLQAAVLRVKLRHLDAWNLRRRALADRYTQLLGGIPEVRLPSIRPDMEHVYHLYVIRVPRRDKLLTYLRAAGIGAAVHYPAALHLTEPFRPLGGRVGDFPVAERAATEVLSLPMYPEMTASQVDSVAERVAAFFGRG